MQINKNLIMIAMASSLAACGSGSDNKAPEFTQSSFSFSVDEDQAVTGSVSATDPNSGDSLSYTLASAAANGVLEINADGSFVYTPNTDFAGEDSATVSVSDGNLSATATVTFTVNNINDAPVIETSTVTVGSQGTTTGAIVATDADGDDLTFAIVTAPEHGDITLDSATGEFEYTPYTLEQVDGSFVISVTDGIISEPVEAEISLAASFVTNADKLNYYYTSEQSHLKQAEALMDAIGDDEYLNEVKASLAVGYTTAGFDSVASDYIDSVTTLDGQADAYLSVGERLDSFGLYESGDEQRAASIAVFNQYLAEKGLSNLSSNDAQYFISVINDYGDSGNSEAANALITTLRIYADAINSDEYTTTYGRILSASRINITDLQDAYFESGSEEDLQRAIEATDLLTEFAANIGYRVITRGDYEGQHSYQMRVLYYSWAAEHYFNLNQPEKAKQYLAEALALYGVTGYDTNYIVEASDSAEATYSAYTSTIEILAGLFAYYYPDAETNLALDLLVEGTANYEDALIFIYMTDALVAIENGADFSAVIDSARTYFTENVDLREYYEFLVQQGAGTSSGSSIGLAKLLVNRGYYDEALTVLNEALTVLQDETYIYDSSALWTFGSYGCSGLNRLYVKAGGESKTIVDACYAIAEKYYQPSQNINTDEAIQEAYSDLLALYATIGATDEMGSVADDIVAIAAEFEESTTSLEFQAHASATLASYGLSTQAVEMADLVFDGLTALRETETGQTADSVDAQLEIIQLLSSGTTAITSYYDLYNTKTALRMHSTTTEDFATLFPAFLAKVQTAVTATTAVASKLTDNEQQDLMEELIQANAYAQLFDEAEALVSSDINELAEEYEYYALLASILAEKDDFPTQLVANVDTDNDGLVNFFLTSVSDDEIAASGLVMDEDSDNDGIADSEDSSPLIANDE